MKGNNKNYFTIWYEILNDFLNCVFVGADRLSIDGFVLYTRIVWGPDNSDDVRGI